jgi:prevent-host-death family protein
MESEVGVRELKAKLSEYLRRVREGETVVVTMHGKPVGRIVPIEQGLEAKLEAMVAAGLAKWSGKHLPAEPPEDRPLIGGERTLSDLVIEDRG